RLAAFDQHAVHGLSRDIHDGLLEALHRADELFEAFFALRVGAELRFQFRKAREHLALGLKDRIPGAVRDGGRQPARELLEKLIVTGQYLFPALRGKALDFSEHPERLALERARVVADAVERPQAG